MKQLCRSAIKGLNHPGNTPQNLARQSLFELDLRLIRFAEAMSYQERIDRNHRRNESIAARINLGIKAVCIAPFIYLVVLGAMRFT